MLCVRCALCAVCVCAVCVCVATQAAGGGAAMTGAARAAKGPRGSASHTAAGGRARCVKTHIRTHMTLVLCSRPHVAGKRCNISSAVSTSFSSNSFFFPPPTSYFLLPTSYFLLATHQVELCVKNSQSASSGKCAAHGGGWRCKVNDCAKFAQGPSYVGRCFCFASWIRLVIYARLYS